MNQTVEKLAALVNGTVRGDRLRVISDAAAIESAGPSAVTFVVDASHISRLKECQAGAMVLEEKIASTVAESVECPLIIVADASLAFQTILPLFRKVRGRPERGISNHAHISPTAQIGAHCFIAPGVCIGDDAIVGANCDLHPGVVIGAGSQIGENTILYPNVVLYHDVVIGNNVILHSGAVIGADGFGYRFVAGKFEKIPQLGTTHIQDNVEIGACTTVDRGAIGPTVIGTGTKLDNLVMIGHNCEIGRHNVFASQTGVAGSCTTGDYIRLGGQAGIADHLELGDGCTVAAKAGVMNHIPAGEVWLGAPAGPEAEQKRLMITMKRLPEMRTNLKELEKQVASLTAELEQLKAAISKSQDANACRAA